MKLVATFGIFLTHGFFKYDIFLEMIKWHNNIFYYSLSFKNQSDSNWEKDRVVSICTPLKKKKMKCFQNWTKVQFTMNLFSTLYTELNWRMTYWVKSSIKCREKNRPHNILISFEFNWIYNLFPPNAKTKCYLLLYLCTLFF